MNLNFKQWFESDPGPTQMTPVIGPNPMQVPVPKSNKDVLDKKPRPLGRLTPNFPKDKRDF